MFANVDELVRMLAVLIAGFALGLIVAVRYISRRYWVRRIDRVLNEAYKYRVIDSWTLHELDYRMKYDPERSWMEVKRDV